MATAALITTTAIFVPIVIFLVSWGCIKSICWIAQAKQESEKGEWLIEAILVKAYGRFGMRPSPLHLYLKAVIIVRTAWIIAASVTLHNYIITWMPDILAWPYWGITGTIITMSIMLDAMRIKKWRTMSAGRYHPLQDLPFH